MKQYLFLFLFSITIHLHSFAQWQEINTNLDSHHFGMAFSDPLNGFIVGSDTDSISPQNTGGKIFKTSDGGITWNVVLHSPNIATQVNDIDFAGSDSFLACNRKDIVFRTNNEGLAWDTTAFNGFGFTNKEIDMVNEDIGYLTGWTGQVFKTEDGGDNWNEVFFLGMIPFRPLECITCISADTCFAGGTNQLIVRTIDGGNNWEILNQNTGTAVQSITHISNDVLIAVGGSIVPGSVGSMNGFILRSEDFGMTWDSISYPSTQYINGFTDVAFSGNTGYVIGDFQTIYESIDMGDTWELVHQDPTFIGFLNEIILFDENSGYICGDYGSLFKMGIPTHTGTLINEMEIDVFPNPFNDYIQFKSNNTITNGKIIIFDNLGRVVEEIPWENSKQLYLDNFSLPNGIYFFSILENGIEIFNEKIIRQK